MVVMPVIMAVRVVVSRGLVKMPMIVLLEKEQGK